MAKKDVAVVIFDGVQALDVAGPLDVFAIANDFLPEEDHYHCVLVAASTERLRSSNGMWMVADVSFEQARQHFHTVLVAGGPDLPVSQPDAAMSEWLRQWGSTARRYGSICTGAFVLGHAGLLNGRTVTTHWLCSEQLARQFPLARVVHDRIHARDERLVTSAGVTAGIDLSLALVAEDHGSAVSLACAKMLVVVAQRQGGQSQFSPLLVAPRNPQTPLGKVQTYVMEHVGESFSVERLADIGGVSPRSIARLFVTELGVTPHDYVEGVRLDQARNLLESTTLALKTIAFDCGFSGPAQMRNAFQRRINVTPLQYRSSFRRE